MEIHSEMTQEWKRNETNPKQPKAASCLKIGDRIQHSFRYLDDETNKEAMWRCAGKVITLSNGNNLRQGASFYRKNGSAEIECNSNADVNEEVSASMVEIKKSLFIAYVKHKWKLDLGVARSNNPLYLAVWC